MVEAGTLGLLFAALSAFFNGSFGVFTKLRMARGVSPLIINYWMAEGVGLSGLLLLAVPPRVFTWWGLLSGMLFVASSANAVTAISLIGLSVASGVWCGTAVLVSFLYGVLVAGDQVQRMGLAALALGLILAGIAGIALAGWAGGAHGREALDGSEGAMEEGGDSQQALLDSGGSTASAGHANGLAAWQQQLRPGSRVLLGLAAAVLAGGIGGVYGAAQLLLRAVLRQAVLVALAPVIRACCGLVAATLAGIWGGLILAPMLRAPPEAQGIQFVPSLACGALVVAPLVTAILTGASGNSFAQATSSRAAGPGMAAGVVWNIGNACCIAAVTNPHVGLAVAMPLMQCGLFVAGIWGIMLFGEIRGRLALSVYWLSGAVLVGGAALLAAAKGG